LFILAVFLLSEVRRRKPVTEEVIAD
jgi:hypothetical protein